jgi:hypothetical protein
MASGGLVSVMSIGETYLHKTSNLRLCPLQSHDHGVNHVMQGVAQPISGLHCKASIWKLRNWVNWRPWFWWGLLVLGLFSHLWVANSYKEANVVFMDGMRGFSPIFLIQVGYNQFISEGVHYSSHVTHKGLYRLLWTDHTCALACVLCFFTNLTCDLRVAMMRFFAFYFF